MEGLGSLDLKLKTTSFHRFLKLVIVEADQGQNYRQGPKVKFNSGVQYKSSVVQVGKIACLNYFCLWS